MSGARVHFANARLIDPLGDTDRPGGVLAEAGRILDSGPQLAAAGTGGDATVVDCAGHALAPGIVDMDVSVGEPGERHKESFGSSARAAAAGGITTMVTQPDTRPPIDSPEILEFVQRRAAASRVRVRPMAALTKGRKGREMAEYGFLVDAGAVALTDGDRVVANASVFRRCLEYAAALDALVVHHAQEPALAGAGVVTEGLFATRLGLPGIPAKAESIQLARDLRIASLTDVRYHAAQLTTADALAALRRARDAGQQVSAGIPATHLALNEFDVGAYRTYAKLVPPLRAEADREAVEEALAGGWIDVITSGHRPQDEESKRQPFEIAAPGAAGLDTLLAVSLRLHHGGRCTLPALFRRLSLTPSRLLGLEGGHLQKGAPADLVLFDPDAPWVVDRYLLHSKCRNTPFDGVSLQGRVLRTVVGGETVFTAGGDPA